MKLRQTDLNQRFNAAFVSEVLDAAEVLVHFATNLLQRVLASFKDELDIPLAQVLPGDVVFQSCPLEVLLEQPVRSFYHKRFR